MKLKVISPAAPGEGEGTYRLHLVSDDGSPLNVTLDGRERTFADGAMPGCPHIHPTYEEALTCAEARVTIGDITGTPLPDLID